MKTIVASSLADAVRPLSGGPPVTARGFLCNHIILSQWFEHGASLAEAFPLEWRNWKCLA